MDLITIREKLSKLVLYQPDLINKLTMCVYRHIIKLESLNENLEYTPNNLLIMGQTGTGKTFAVKSLAKMLDLPFIEINSKSISQEGWEGISLLKLLQKGLENNEGSLMRQYPIIFLDEFDKLCKPMSSSSSENVSEHLQTSILKYIEGFEIIHNRINYHTGRFCFIFAGAFTDLWKEQQAEVGFHNTIHNENITSERLINYGMIPELVGRITRIVRTNDCTSDVFRELLCNPNFISNQWFNYLKNNGCNRLTEPNYSFIIEETIKKNLGIRGLVQMLDLEIDKILEDSDLENINILRK